MKRLGGLGEVRGELARLRGTVNLSEWLLIAKSLRGRNLFLAIGETRLAGLEGVKALRDKLDEVGLASSKLGAVIEGIVSLWLDEQITGEIDLAQIVRGMGRAGADLKDQIKQHLVPVVVEEAAAPVIIVPPPPSPPPSPPIVPAPAPEMPEQMTGMARLREQIDELVAQDDDPKVWRQIARLQVELAAIHQRRRSDFGEGVSYSLAAEYLLRIAEHNSQLVDFQRAIKCYDLVIACFRCCDREHLANCLSYAGEARIKMARQTGLRADWESAIAYLEEAAKLFGLENNNQQMAHALSFLGETQMRLAEFETDPAEKISGLRKGISYYEQAERSLPAKHLPFVYNRLGHAHLQIAEITKEIAEWQAALGNLKKAVQGFESAGVKLDRAYALGYTGEAAYAIAERTSDPAMWTEAVDCYLASSAALEEKMVDCHQAAHCLYFAAKAQGRLAELSGSDAEFEKEADYRRRAVDLYQRLNGVKYAKRIAESLNRIIIIRWNLFSPAAPDELLLQIVGLSDEMAKAAKDCGAQREEIWAYKQGANAEYELAQRKHDAEGYRQSIERRAAALRLYIGRQQFERAAACCSHLGNAYYELALLAGSRADLEMALVYVRRAASLFEALQLKDRFEIESAFILDIRRQLEAPSAG